MTTKVDIIDIQSYLSGPKRLVAMTLFAFTSFKDTEHLKF